MKTRIFRWKQHLLLPIALPASLFAALVASLLIAPAAFAAGQAEPASATRIAGEISSSRMTVLPGSKRPQAVPANDTGRLAPSTKLQGIGIQFTRTPAQEADLQTLMAAQQNPSSPLYHQWLTPEQFGARFGLDDEDIAKIETWLEQQGFSIDSVARGKTMLRFSGTAAQVEAAFATELHTYAVKTRAGAVENHFAASTDISIPSALAGVVQGVHNLDDFRPKPHVIFNSKLRAKPAFSGGIDDSIFFAPGDIATQYGIQSVYNAGYTGDGQTIAVVGQSEVSLSDVEAFQSAAGLPIKDPNLVLVPGTGSPAVSAGDEAESDLDMEWSGAVAKGATISLVYTGGASNLGAFDAIEYAIDWRIANIVSISYGDCESDLAGFSLETFFDQAATQGQTVMSAAGDNGSTDCYGNSDQTLTEQEALAVDYPGSSPNVTSVGGTEISQANSAYESQGSAYWEAASGSSDVITSLLQPVPEQAWNEDSLCVQQLASGGSPICSGGGGASTLFTKPTWQTGVPGIPSDGKRDVPDIALDAAIFNPGYLFCSSDQSAWASSQAASCNSGFRDASSGDVTAAGGTSFATPIFAGMIAILNQQQNYVGGQGLVNPELYKLAANATTYGTAFNDIQTGNNDCLSGSSYCNGSIGFSAGTGYDQATGLGTINLASLIGAWPASSGSTLVASTTSVSATNTAPTVNTADTFTISVTSDTGTTVPSGTVNVSVDGGTAVPETLTSNGTYVYSTTFATAGPHTVLAEYAGDTTHAASTGSVTVTVAGTTSGSGTFALSASNLTVAQGNNGNSNITVTPSGGYTGTVLLNFDTSNDNALQNLCYQFTNTLSDGDGSVTVTGTTAVTTQLNLDTNAADCASSAAIRKTGKQSFRSLHRARSVASGSNSSEIGGGTTAPAAIAFAGLLLAGLLGRKARKLRSVAGAMALALVAVLALAVSACGGSGNSGPSDPPKGTYTITLTGQDSSNAAIPTATATFTFTID